MNKKIVILGSQGQLGWELMRACQSLGHISSIARNNADYCLDFTHFEMLKQCLHEIKPDIIINAAAYTAVDQAEKKMPLAFAVNAELPAVLAQHAKASNALLIHYSTDYVFDGHKSTPYIESDDYAPISVYGQSKLQGDLNIQATLCSHIILRISWVYGLRNNNFLKTMLTLYNSRDELNIINDQHGIPMWSRMIAEITAQIIAKNALNPIQEVFHLGGTESTTWYHFAKAILALSDMQCLIKPITTEQYPLPAKRPINSVLSATKLAQTFHLSLPDWQTMLKLCMER